MSFVKPSSAYGPRTNHCYDGGYHVNEPLVAVDDEDGIEWPVPPYTLPGDNRTASYAGDEWVFGPPAVGQAMIR
jgi:hypothetical protein